MAAIYWYAASSSTMSWPTILLIIYGVGALLAAGLALFFEYPGENPRVYTHFPERYRNRRWVKPLLPIIFVILPALLWPIVMVGLGIFILAAFLFDKKDGIWKNMKGGRKEKDVEMGLRTDVRPNEQSIPEHNPAVTANSANATTIHEPPPAYTPQITSRRLPLEGETAQ